LVEWYVTELESLAGRTGLDPEQLRDYLRAEIERRSQVANVATLADGYTTGTSLHPLDAPRPSEAAQL
jgi:hypothetical protein